VVSADSVSSRLVYESLGEDRVMTLAGNVVVGLMLMIGTHHDLAAHQGNLSQLTAAARPVTISVENRSIKQLLDEMGMIGNVSIVVAPESAEALEKRLNLTVTNVKFGEVLEIILKDGGLEYMVIDAQRIAIRPRAAP
jgi:hypothetical protein